MVNAKIVLHDLDLIFECKKLNVYTMKQEELAQKWVRDICRFLHVQLYGVIAKIVLCDRDQLVEVKIF